MMSNFLGRPREAVGGRDKNKMFREILLLLLVLASLFGPIIFFVQHHATAMRDQITINATHG